MVHEFVVHSVKKEKDAKKRVSNSPQTKRRNKQSIPTFESPQEKKKEPISKSVSSEGLVIIFFNFLFQLLFNSI